MFRQFFLLSILVLAFCLIVDQTDAAPHKKHAACELRLFKSLNALCNKVADLEVIRETATRCCKENCDLMEMMSVCTLDADSL